jgi:hypothetical protein
MKGPKQEEDLSTGAFDEGNDSFVDDGDDDSARHDSAAKAPRRIDSQIAGRESRFVLCSKTMAYLVLFLASVACGVVTYIYISDQEEADFVNDVRRRVEGTRPGDKRIPIKPSSRGLLED